MSRPGTPELPTTERLQDLARAMERAHTIVFADLVADRFVSGRPARISREAPVLILELEEETLLPGGGANAAANIASLGGNAHLFGAVGADDSGRALLAELERSGADLASIIVRDDWRTPTKTRILGGASTGIKQQIVRLDAGGPLAARDEERRAHLGTLEALWQAFEEGPPTPVIVVSDYGYGAVDPELLTATRRIVGDEAQILVDSRRRIGDFVGASGATPNQEEAERLAGRSLDSDEAIVETGPRLLDGLELELLLITRGSRGMALFQRDAPPLLIPVHGTDQVADVTGAGDTVIGTLGLALSAGATPVEAALLANYAGGSVVMKLGTATLDASELRDAIRVDPQLLERLRWVES